jgi:hypothetical protein
MAHHPFICLNPTIKLDKRLRITREIWGEPVTEEDKIKKLAELRALLEKRVKEMEAELEGLRVLLDFVNAALVEKGFKRAEIAKTAPTLTEEKLTPPTPPPAEVEAAPPPVLEHEQAVPIKTATGEMLANLYMDKDSMRVVIAEDKRFTVDIPPFMAFLVERVLAKMQEKDREAAEAGEIAPDKILSYSIIRDGDILREITIRNIESDRARELKSTIRWTLEKMYEKTKTSA